MEGKHDRIFDEFVVACKAKHLRDIMDFIKNWYNETISQFFFTLYVEERADTRKFHRMIEEMWYEITYEYFARLFGFGRGDANHNKIHKALHLDASKLKFMYPKNKRGNVGTTTDLLPFYAYLNRLFRKTMTPKKEIAPTFLPTTKTSSWLWLGDPMNLTFVSLISYGRRSRPYQRALLRVVGMHLTSCT
jgi:hypothetical protein